MTFEIRILNILKETSFAASLFFMSGTFKSRRLKPARISPAGSPAIIRNTEHRTRNTETPTVFKNTDNLKTQKHGGIYIDHYNNINIRNGLFSGVNQILKLIELILNHFQYLKNNSFLFGYLRSIPPQKPICIEKQYFIHNNNNHIRGL